MLRRRAAASFVRGTISADSYIETQKPPAVSCPLSKLLAGGRTPPSVGGCPGSQFLVHPRCFPPGRRCDFAHFTVAGFG